MSSRIRIVSSSTSASDTLMSPATTSPLSSTRSRTSTRPVDRPCPSVNDVGIGSVFYENFWHSRIGLLDRKQLSQQRWCHQFGGDRLSNAAWLHRSPTVGLDLPYKFITSRAAVR